MTEVTITKKRLDDLLKAEAELDALHAGGVDNWEWYYESLKNADLAEDDDEDDEED